MSTLLVLALTLVSLAYTDSEKKIHKCVGTEANFVEGMKLPRVEMRIPDIWGDYDQTKLDLMEVGDRCFTEWSEFGETGKIVERDGQKNCKALIPGSTCTLSNGRLGRIMGSNSMGMGCVELVDSDGDEIYDHLDDCPLDPYNLDQECLNDLPDCGPMIGYALAAVSGAGAVVGAVVYVTAGVGASLATGGAFGLVVLVAGLYCFFAEGN